MADVLSSSIEPVLNGNRKLMGTAFCIGVDSRYAYLATAAHVIQKALNTESQTESIPRENLKGKVVNIGGKNSKVCFGGNDDCDFAVLRREKDSDQKVLKILAGVAQGIRVTVFGHQQGSGTTSSYTIEASITDTKGWEGVNQRFDRLELKKTGEKAFQEKVSGSPVCDKHDRVLGVITQADGADTGFALDLAKLLLKIPFEIPGIRLESNEEGSFAAKNEQDIAELLPHRANRRTVKRNFGKIYKDLQNGFTPVMVFGTSEAERGYFFEICGRAQMRLPDSNIFEVGWSEHLDYYHEPFENRLLLETGSSLPQIVSALPNGDILIIVEGSVTDFSMKSQQTLKKWLLQWRKLKWDRNGKVIIGIGIPFHERVGHWLGKGFQFFCNLWIEIQARWILGSLKEMRNLGKLGLIDRDAVRDWENGEAHEYGKGHPKFKKNLSKQLDRLFLGTKSMTMREWAAESRIILEKIEKN